MWMKDNRQTESDHYTSSQDFASGVPITQTGLFFSSITVHPYKCSFSHLKSQN